MTAIPQTPPSTKSFFFVSGFEMPLMIHQKSIALYGILPRWEHDGWILPKLLRVSQGEDWWNQVGHDINKSIQSKTTTHPQPLEPKGGRGTLVVSSITFSSLFREAIATCDWEGAPKIWLDARVGAKPIHYSRPKCRVCRVPQWALMKLRKTEGGTMIPSVLTLHRSIS